MKKGQNKRWEKACFQKDNTDKPTYFAYTESERNEAARKVKNQKRKTKRK